jgi:two-component system, response regulator PdtaR
MPRILITEDELILAYALRGQLERRGVEVVGLASNGRVALERCRETRPEVVLMDVRMPEMDGIEATRLIMQNCPTSVIMLTAYADEETRAKAEAAGAMGFLAKPVQATAVIEAITGAQKRFAEFQIIRREAGDLEEALKTRRLVEIAKAMLAGRGEVKIDEAFQSLLERAAKSGATLRATAEKMVEA